MASQLPNSEIFQECIVSEKQPTHLRISPTVIWVGYGLEVIGNSHESAPKL